MYKVSIKRANGLSLTDIHHYKTHDVWATVLKNEEKNNILNDLKKKKKKEERDKKFSALLSSQVMDLYR
jgi:hypothetical protein